MFAHFAADAGNSTIKLALYKGGQMVQKAILDDASWQAFDPSLWLKGDSYHFISSTVREGHLNLPPALRPDGVCLTVGAHLRFPFQIAYSTPETIGADRLANAAGALVRFGPDCLIIDSGTCLTYTALERGILTGGAIAPGIRMRYRALHAYSGRLPGIDQPASGAEFPGSSTLESMHAGVCLGAAAEAADFISRMCSRTPNTVVILTGGDAPFLATLLKTPIFADPDLTLSGLHEILKLNLG
ncbi:MAG: type III pantothenate kinase [Flavobacteriales bacterium]|jgi:type III pantothenate kinase